MVIGKGLGSLYGNMCTIPNQRCHDPNIGKESILRLGSEKYAHEKKKKMAIMTYNSYIHRVRKQNSIVSSIILKV
jgi:hypothetical protein